MQSVDGSRWLHLIASARTAFETTVGIRNIGTEDDVVKESIWVITVFTNLQLSGYLGVDRS